MNRDEIIPISLKELRVRNIKKYKGIPPSWELVEKTIKRSGLKRQSQFEIIWGISRKLLTQYKNGSKILPCKYWHIFYDFDNIKTVANKKMEENNIKSKRVTILGTNKQFLDAVQTR